MGHEKIEQAIFNRRERERFTVDTDGMLAGFYTQTGKFDPPFCLIAPVSADYGLDPGQHLSC
jgi:hypothetical protein